MLALCNRIKIAIKRVRLRNHPPDLILLISLSIIIILIIVITTSLFLGSSCTSRHLDVGSEYIDIHEGYDLLFAEYILSANQPLDTLPNTDVRKQQANGGVFHSSSAAAEAVATGPKITRRISSSSSTMTQYHHQQSLESLLTRAEDEKARHYARAVSIAENLQTKVHEKHPRLGDYPIPNPPLIQKNEFFNSKETESVLDLTQFRVYGDGLGARMDGAGGSSVVIAGHLLLPSNIPQRVPKLSELIPCVLHSTCTFFVQASDTNGSPIGFMNTADIRARLFGPTISAIHVKSVGNGKYMCSYTPQDAGLYIVEVYVAWVEGYGEERTRNVTNHFSIPFIMNQLIYRSQHILEISLGGAESRRNEGSEENLPSATAAAAAAVPLLPICTTADAGPGRWVYMKDGICTPPYCSGVTQLADIYINDPVGLNKDYIWVPYSCRYRLFTSHAVHQCASSCGYRHWTFQGDSVGREMLQNMQMIFTRFDPSFPMPKLKEGNATWTIVYEESAEETSSRQILSEEMTGETETRKKKNEKKTTSFAYLFEWQPRTQEGDVRVYQGHDAHVLIDAETLLSARLQAMYKKNVLEGVVVDKEKLDQEQEQEQQQQRKRPRQSFHYVSPTLQREVDQTRDRMKPGNVYSYITSARMNVLSEWGREIVEMTRSNTDNEIHILDGQTISAPHWWGSWDGLHYSQNAPLFGLQDNRWFGGVSMMITQMLLNELCNQPCAMSES